MSSGKSRKSIRREPRSNKMKTQSSEIRRSLKTHFHKATLSRVFYASKVESVPQFLGLAPAFTHGVQNTYPGSPCCSTSSQLRPPAEIQNQPRQSTRMV